MSPVLKDSMKSTLPTPRVNRRDEFKLPPESHYLNCAYMGPLSRKVESAAQEALHTHRWPGNLPAEKYFSVPDRVREKFNQLINGYGKKSIAIIPSVSYAMAIATRNMDVSKRQNVVVIGEEFPSAVLPWRRLAREKGCELRTVECPDVDAGRGAAWNEAIYNAIDGDTTAVILSNVHWCDGTLFDLAGLSARAREVGALVCIDATQSLGALPLDVQQIKPDLLVASAYKWLMGGYGHAVMYVSERMIDCKPIEEVWTSQKNSENFVELTTYQDAYRTDASRFDGGQRANFILNAMLEASISQLMEWGVENIQQYCQELVEPVLDDLNKAGLIVEPITDRASHLFGVRPKKPWNTVEVVNGLRKNGVFVSGRGDLIRVSPNVYNTPDDMRALVDGLKSVMG